MNPTFSPLYQQIKGLLIKSLQDGEWKPGELIPSETELAARYGVSQGTVRKAIDELAAENLVDRKQGRGTFVATHNEAKSEYRFLRLAADEEPSAKPKSTYLSVERVRANSQVAKLLDIKASDSVFVVKRVMRFEGTPRIFDEIWLPASQYKGLTLERLQQWNSTLYGFLESAFGVRMLRASEHIKAVSANAEQSEHLQVATGTPLLLVERLSLTYADRPVELRRGWYLTDRFSYRNELY
ncbi:GntR family transcriptional regulator [Limnobacter sp.]|uniref:GntR family transcriptional regulator n=1 Tax=Limnobacter sp. TaxID=2003368 RepID=UPI00351419F0